MKTKELIKGKALELFNQFGISKTTLRYVAEELQKSYGNITYHFKTKEILITELYNDLATELLNIRNNLNTNNDYILFDLSRKSFDITVKYMLFSIDYIELKRNYPTLMEKVDRDNQIRTNQYKLFLNNLQKCDIIKQNITNTELDYLMELSGAFRIYFFQKNYGKEIISSEYITYVNNLVYPYLSLKGSNLLNDWESKNIIKVNSFEKNQI